MHRDVTASGVRLRVAERGSGAPVLLIHGLFYDHRTWDLLMPELGQEYRVIAPDLPGFGASEKPPESRFPYGVEAFAEAMADLYAGLELSRATVIGHGLGGGVAMTLSARHPELVSRLVLIDPLCYPAEPGIYERASRLPILGGFLVKQLWGKRLFRLYFRRRLIAAPARLPIERIDRYYENFNTPSARGSALATLRAMRDTRPIMASTHTITTPTLVVWGRNDAMYPAQLGHRLAREIRNAGIEIIDAGHSPQEENPADLGRVVVRFLTDRPLPRSVRKR